MICNKIFFDKPLVLLDQFAEYVDEDRLDRLCYPIWRDLKKLFIEADLNDKQIGMCFNEDGYLMIGTSSRDIGDFDPKVVDEVFIGDETFGTFIHNMLQGRDEPWAETKPSFCLAPNSLTNAYIKIDDNNWVSCSDAVIEKVNNITSVDLSVDRCYDTTTRTDSTVTINGDLIVKGKIINEERESNNNMKFNFDFGSCENDNVRMSPYGIAIKNAENTWVSYDAKSGNIVDVDIFNFEGGKYLFKMPVAVKDIKPGDVVIHNRVPMYVLGTDNGIVVIDPRVGETKSILPVTNMFGFNFVTKVVSLLDGAIGTPSSDNPFGNMLPFFLMSNSNDKKGDIDPLMMAMLLNGNAACNFQNPMMMALLCADQTNMRDVLPLMMLAGQTPGLAVTPTNVK